MTHNTATIEELSAAHTKNGVWTFSHKGRRWYTGAFIPFLDGYEIHTYTGDKTTVVSKDFICKNIEFYID